jgi:predicted Zn-ribbon and HTH transcriptional regulator
MAFTKIVQRLNIQSVCPKCRTVGFDYQPGADPHDQLMAPVQCPNCGWKGLLGDRDLEPSQPPKSN